MRINGIYHRTLKNTDIADSTVLNFSIRINDLIYNVAHVLSGVYDNNLLNEIATRYFENLTQSGVLKEWGNTFHVKNGTEYNGYFERHDFDGTQYVNRVITLLNRSTGYLDNLVTQNDFELLIDQVENDNAHFLSDIGDKPTYLEHHYWLDYQPREGDIDETGVNHVIEACGHISAIYTNYAKEAHALTTKQEYTPVKSIQHIYEFAVDNEIVYRTGRVNGRDLTVTQEGKTPLYITIFNYCIDELRNRLRPLTEEYSKEGDSFYLQMMTHYYLEDRNKKSNQTERIVKRINFNFTLLNEDVVTKEEIKKLKVQLKRYLVKHMEKANRFVLEASQSLTRLSEHFDYADACIKTIIKPYVREDLLALDDKLPF